MQQYGSIIFSNNLSEVYVALQRRYTVIALVEDMRPFETLEGVVGLASLLPPAAAIAAEIDGDMEKAYMIYEQHLCSDTSLRSLAAILTALVGRINIMIFVPPEESMNFRFLQTFSDVFFKLFGIQIGDTVSDSIMHASPEQLSRIADLCFLFGYWPFELYCEQMPYGYPPTEKVVIKILQSYGYQFSSYKEASDWVVSLIAHTKSVIERNNELPSGEKIKQSIAFLSDQANKIAQERKPV